LVGHGAVGDAADEGAELVAGELAAVALLPDPFGDHASSSRKLVPCAGAATPNACASVAPTSEKVARTPRSRPAAQVGPKARMGTCSREWSVDGVVGSLPWSAETRTRSPGRSAFSSRGMKRSNSARHAA